MGYKSKIAQRVIAQRKDIINDYTALELINHIPNAETVGSMELYDAVNQVDRIFLNLKIPAERIHIIRAVASMPLGTEDVYIVDHIIKHSEELYG